MKNEGEREESLKYKESGDELEQAGPGEAPGGVCCPRGEREREGTHTHTLMVELFKKSQ